MPLALTFLLRHSSLFIVLLSAVAIGNPVSFFIWSTHLRGGLPGCLFPGGLFPVKFPLYALKDELSIGRLLIGPKYFSRRVWTVSTIFNLSQEWYGLCHSVFVEYGLPKRWISDITFQKQGVLFFRIHEASKFQRHIWRLAVLEPYKGVTSNFDWCHSWTRYYLLVSRRLKRQAWFFC